jgi:hypothetical protein
VQVAVLRVRAAAAALNAASAETTRRSLSEKFLQMGYKMDHNMYYPFGRLKS